MPSQGKWHHCWQESQIRTCLEALLMALEQVTHFFPGFFFFSSTVTGKHESYLLDYYNLIIGILYLFVKHTPTRLVWRTFWSYQFNKAQLFQQRHWLFLLDANLCLLLQLVLCLLNQPLHSPAPLECATQDPKRTDTNGHKYIFYFSRH